MVDQLQVWVLCERCHNAHEVGYAAFFERPVRDQPPHKLLGPTIYFFVGLELTSDI